MPPPKDRSHLFKPGQSGNPTGRPSDKAYRKLIKDTFGENLEGLHFLRLCLMTGAEIRFAEQKKIVKIIKDPEVRKRFKKFCKSTGLDQKQSIRSKFSSIKVTDILNMLDKMETRVMGNVATNVKAEVQTTAISVKVDLPKDLDEDDF